MRYEEYTKEEIDWLREFYPEHTLKETQAAFNEHFGTEYTLSQVKHRICKNGIKNNNDSKFKAKHDPWNKGMSIKEERPEIYEKYFGRNSDYQRLGFITKGHPVGTTKKIGKAYFVKVTENEWIPRSRYLWEQKHGKLKDGEKLLHLDGNKENDALDNLIIVDNKILARLNKKCLIFKNGELTEIAVNQQKLLQMIKDIENE